MSQSTGADEISFNMIKNCFEELSDILRESFRFFFGNGFFRTIKIEKVIPVFKTGDLKEISNSRSNSVLPCFSKILVWIMHNCLHRYLVNEKNIIFEGVRLLKRSFHRACHCAVSWPNSWNIRKRQLHTWGFYWFIQGLWHYWPYKIIKKLTTQFQLIVSPLINPWILCWIPFSLHPLLLLFGSLAPPAY